MVNLNRKKETKQGELEELRNQIITCLLLANSAPNMSDNEFLDWSGETADKIIKTIKEHDKKVRANERAYFSKKIVEKINNTECYLDINAAPYLKVTQIIEIINKLAQLK